MINSSFVTVSFKGNARRSAVSVGMFSASYITSTFAILAISNSSVIVGDSI